MADKKEIQKLDLPNIDIKFDRAIVEFDESKVNENRIKK